MPATAQATATRNTPPATPGRNTNSTTSLWDTANTQLDRETQTLLAEVNTGNGCVVDEALTEAITQQKALAAKRWKATIGGKEVILRDVLGKIIRWIDHFKAAGDIAVQFNSGAASLPWAAVRFLLQVAVNDRQYLEATIEGIEIATQTIARYAAVENLYMDSDFQLHTQIRSKILGLYVHTLSFLGESIQYFQHNLARRTVKGAFQTSQSERLRQIAKHDTDIHQLANLCDSHVQQLIRIDITRINENIMTSLKAQSFSDFIAWLSLTPYKEHHTRHSKNRLRGTTQWLINDSRYLDWKSSASSSLLWLRGILGSGKTNLVSAVIDESLLQSAQAQASPVLYYYCGDVKGHGGRCDAKDVMRSLLRQLTVKNDDTFEIVEQVHLEFKRREARGKVGMGKVDALEPEECTHWITELLQSDQATIIIDAIDEIDVADRHLLLRELITLRDDPARILKIFVSSRDDTNLSQWLKGVTEIRLQASLTQTDMQNFIGHCVSSAIDNKQLLDGLVDSALQSELESYFLDRASGMFRWVELQLRHFCDLKLSHSIEQAMLDPAGASIHTLNHLYATIFDRIVKTDPLAYNVAAQIFRLMMCLHEVMPPTALLAAASITRDRVQYSLELSDLLRTCSCLVVLDDELDTLRFAHVSVQEYLARLPEFSITNANNAAASSCLIRCIDNPLPDLTIGIQPARGFDLYAAMYWPLHYNAASEHDRNGYLRDVLKEFMFSNEDFMSPFPLWIETIDEISKTLSGPHARLMDLAAIGSESATPLFTACIYGLEFAIEVLSEMSAFDVNQKNRRGHTGLYLASAAGQTRVVDRLLKLGADVGIEGGRHMTALQAACANGHGDIAQLILDFSSQTLTAGTITSAVQAALRNDREHVALILLKRSPLPMSQDTFDPVFEAAAGMGFTELLNYLHSTSNSLSDKTKLIPSGAERTFHDSKVDLFPKYFQNRALPNDAIATAAFYGQNKIIEFCIDKGLDIEHEGPFGTPLRAASLMGHGTTVRLLLDRDVEINANGSFGDALQAAAMRGHLSITTILIQSGVAVDNSGGYYGNALQAATYRGHIDVVKALLAAGAPIGQNGLFSDAMTAAVSAGNQPIADLLLRSGYQSLHFFDEDEIMRMSSAYMRDPHPSHLDLLSALDTTHQYERTRQADRANAIQERDLSFQEAYKSIQTGAEVENVTELPNLEHTKRYNSHALLVATTTGQESVVRTMLDARFVIGLSLLDIGIVLKVASAAGRHGIVDYILSIPDLPRDYIPRALERAAWYGHVAIIKRLLKCQEAYGPPPSSRYAPFTPDSHWVRLTPRRDNGFGRVPDGDKKIRWLNYFPLPYEVVETNETAENGHIARILLQGCRANAPATVEFALELAAEYGLQNLPAVALATTIRSNSGQALEVLLRHYPAVDAIVLEKACAQAEQDEALSALYVLLNHHIDHGYQLQDYWRVFDGAATAKHSRFISHLTTQTLHCREDSLLEKRFIEAAQRGYVSAMEAWEGRLCESPHHKLALSQALDRACANGHAAVVSYLIERGADVNTIVEEPVQPSSLADHHSVSLHSDGVTKNEVWPRTALQACLQATPQCDRIRGIWNNEFDKFKDKKRAFLSKQQAVIQLLLRKDANVNIVDSHGRNALHYAALYCSVATVQMILASGASISLLDKDNKTPLVYAAWRELDSLTVLEALTTAERQVIKPSEPRTSSVLLLDTALSVFNYGFIESESVHQVLTTGPGAVIKYLLQSQFDLQATGTGFTLLLQMASADGDIDLVQLLIERNVDLKAVAHYYGTALHTAARFGHLDCVKLLVEAGAEIALTAGKFTWTPLRAAVQGHHLAIVQCLLDWGVMRSFDYSMDLSSAGINDRCSTLTFACRSGNIDLVQLLLSYSEQSILMPSQPKEQRTQFADMSSALQGACSHGHAEIAALLIEYGADVEEKSSNSQSLLTTAASTGSLETLKVLLAAGATLFNAERAVNVLRTLVVKEKPKDVIDYVLAHLLDTDDFINACKEVPAHMRAWQEDAKFVLHVDTMRSSERLLAGLAALGAQRSIELLLEKSFDMADVRLPVLQAAAYFQSYDVLFKLLPMVVIPPPIPSGYQSPVYALLEGLMPIKEVENFHKSLCCEAWAADSFQYRVFGQEDKKCACDNARNAASEAIMKLAQIDESHIRKPVGILHLASYLGMLKVVQVCLELGVEINQRHDSFGSALIAAIEGGSSEVVTLLLQRQIDVNTASSELGAPLYLACTTRNTGWRCLVDHTTPTAGTALSRACQSRDREMAEVLLQHGAKVNVLIPSKGTPMHVACEKRDEEMLKLLLKYGADVDIISPDLGAALHVACKSQDFGLVKILLQHGANVNVFSPDHGTPLHAACAGKSGDAIIQLLLKHGADVNSKGGKGETPFTSILSQHDMFSSEPLMESLLKTEQQLNVTENDLNKLLTGFMSSTTRTKICKRVLADNTHLQPTIETIRLVLAGHFGSEILRLLLTRAPHLEITMEIVREAKNLESFELLTQHGSCIKITADVMESFLHPLELSLIKYSLQSVSDVRPPPAVVRAIRAILDQPEPKPMADVSAHHDLYIRAMQHYQSGQKPIAKEIMELILARHPDVEGLPSTTVPDKSQKMDPEA